MNFDTRRNDDELETHGQPGDSVNSAESAPAAHGGPHDVPDFRPRPSRGFPVAAERARWPLPTAVAENREFALEDDDTWQSGPVSRPPRESRRRRRPSHRRLVHSLKTAGVVCVILILLLAIVVSPMLLALHAGVLAAL